MVALSEVVGRETLLRSDRVSAVAFRPAPSCDLATLALATTMRSSSDVSTARRDTAIFHRPGRSTDEARREFETNPSVLRHRRRRAVRREVPETAARALSRGVALQSDMRCGGQPHGATSIRDPLLSLRPHDGGKGSRGMGPQRSRGRRRRTPGERSHIARATRCSALNGYNYWAADRRNPCSVLGMVYALEVVASVYGGPIARRSGITASRR